MGNKCPRRWSGNDGAVRTWGSWVNSGGNVSSFDTIFRGRADESSLGGQSLHILGSHNSNDSIIGNLTPGPEVQSPWGCHGCHFTCPDCLSQLYDAPMQLAAEMLSFCAKANQKAQKLTDTAIYALMVQVLIAICHAAADRSRVGEVDKEALAAVYINLQQLLEESWRRGTGEGRRCRPYLRLRSGQLAHIKLMLELCFSPEFEPQPFSNEMTTLALQVVVAMENTDATNLWSCIQELLDPVRRQTLASAAVDSSQCEAACAVLLLQALTQMLINPFHPLEACRFPKDEALRRMAVEAAALDASGSTEVRWIGSWQLLACADRILRFAVKHPACRDVPGRDLRDWAISAASELARWETRDPWAAVVALNAIRRMVLWRPVIHRNGQDPPSVSVDACLRRAAAHAMAAQSVHGVGQETESVTALMLLNDHEMSYAPQGVVKRGCILHGATKPPGVPPSPRGRAGQPQRAWPGSGHTVMDKSRPKIPLQQRYLVPNTRNFRTMPSEEASAQPSPRAPPPHLGGRPASWLDAKPSAEDNQEAQLPMSPRPSLQDPEDSAKAGSPQGGSGEASGSRQATPISMGDVARQLEAIVNAAPQEAEPSNDSHAPAREGAVFDFGGQQPPVTQEEGQPDLEGSHSLGSELDLQGPSRTAMFPALVLGGPFSENVDLGVAGAIRRHRADLGQDVPQTSRSALPNGFRASRTAVLPLADDDMSESSACVRPSVMAPLSEDFQPTPGLDDPDAFLGGESPQEEAEAVLGESNVLQRPVIDLVFGSSERSERERPEVAEEDSSPLFPAGTPHTAEAARPPKRSSSLADEPSGKHPERERSLVQADGGEPHPDVELSGRESGSLPVKRQNSKQSYDGSPSRQQVSPQKPASASGEDLERGRVEEGDDSRVVSSALPSDPQESGSSDPLPLDSPV